MSSEVFVYGKGSSLLAWCCAALLGCSSSTDSDHGDDCLTGSCRDGAWGAPELISSEHSGDAGFAEVAMNSEGNAAVVWVQGTGSVDELKLQRYDRSSGWSGPETLASSPRIVDLPRVDIDEVGNVFVLWTQGDFAGETTSIWARRHESGKGWSEPLQLSDDNASRPVLPELALNDEGSAFALWWEAEARAIRGLPYDSGSGWGEPTTISAGSLASLGAQVAVGADGSAVAMWSGTSDDPSFPGSDQYANVWWNRYDPETGWDEAAWIEGNGYFNSQTAPVVQLHANGSMSAVWVAPAHPVVASVFGSYDPETGWSAQTLELDSNSPELTVDDDGNALVVWAPGFDQEAPIGSHYIARSTREMTKLEVDAPNPGSVGATPKLAGNAAGDAVAVWYRIDETGEHVWANRYVSGEGWGMPSALAKSTPACGSPCSRRMSIDVAIDGQGNAIVVWSERHDDTHTDHYARVLRP